MTPPREIIKFPEEILAGFDPAEALPGGFLWSGFSWSLQREDPWTAFYETTAGDVVLIVLKPVSLEEGS